MSLVTASCIYSQNLTEQECARNFLPFYSENPRQIPLEKKLDFLSSECKYHFKTWEVGIAFIAYQAYWVYIEDVPSSNKRLLNVFSDILKIYADDPDYVLAGMQLCVAMNKVMLQKDNEEARSEFLKYISMIKKCNELNLDKNFYHQEHYDYGMKVLDGLESDIARKKKQNKKYRFISKSSDKYYYYGYYDGEDLIREIQVFVDYEDGHYTIRPTFGKIQNDHFFSSYTPDKALLWILEPLNKEFKCSSIEEAIEISFNQVIMRK